MNATKSDLTACQRRKVHPDIPLRSTTTRSGPKTTLESCTNGDSAPLDHSLFEQVDRKETEQNSRSLKQPPDVLRGHDGWRDAPPPLELRSRPSPGTPFLLRRELYFPAERDYVRLRRRSKQHVAVIQRPPKKPSVERAVSGSSEKNHPSQNKNMLSQIFGKLSRETFAPVQEEGRERSEETARVIRNQLTPCATTTTSVSLGKLRTGSKALCSEAPAERSLLPQRRERRFGRAPCPRIRIKCRLVAGKEKQNCHVFELRKRKSAMKTPTVYANHKWKVSKQLPFDFFLPREIGCV